MKDMNYAKEQYDEIPIPEELAERVQKAVELSESRQKILRLERRKNKLKGATAAAAAAVAAFTVLLNTNTVFAQEMSNIPVMGAVARILTFRSYETEDEDLKLSVEIPSVEMISQDTEGLDDSINQEILRLCEEYVEGAVQRAEEYKKAFIETGGTEEEWAAHNIEINVDYEIKAQTEDYLSFAVIGSENWNSAHNETKYYTIDLKDGKMVTLEDLLGENYIELANESISAQMQTKSAEEGITFWTPEEGGFTGITADASFYVNEKGNPVIVFDKYEIAPGSAGEIEFEIQR